jgi:hypothetical protein
MCGEHPDRGELVVRVHPDIVVGIWAVMRVVSHNEKVTPR